MDTNLQLKELKEREREARKNIIIAAAERVFAQKPFDQVRIRDIAREAGISHALIYRYFSDQQALFVEAFLRSAGDLLGLIDKAVGKGIESVAETYLKFLIDHDQLFRMMTHFMLDGNLEGDLLHRLNAMERTLLDCLEQFFRKKHQKKESRFMAHAFFAA
jgi:AcrR family transcriptional regulator